MTTPASLTGANVRAEMARRGVSQTILAERIGMSQAQVSKRLPGAIAFDINELHTVAAVLDVPLSTLLPSDDAAVGAA